MFWFIEYKIKIKQLVVVSKQYGKKSIQKALFLKSFEIAKRWMSTF